jgi:CMP/dCMP kinase
VTHIIAPPAIAIDGPAASGKTTIGKMLAEALGYLLLDTGSMYRAATLAVLQKGIDPADEAAVAAVTRDLNLEIRPASSESDGRLYTVLIDGQDVTWELRAPAVDANVSQVSAYAEVRRVLVQQQRDIARRYHVVMVGRDIGTVVLPEAELKLYISASAEERAGRRCRERQSQGITSDYHNILADVIRRDRLDSSRAHSPMRAAADAILIDSTGRSPEAILEQILSLHHFRYKTAAKC